jgi:hypothetical protein
MMKEANPDRFVFIGSNEREEATYKLVCDEWYREPAGLTDEEYVDFCVNFCLEHKIDVFVPRRRLELVSLAHERFNAIGVKLLVDKNGMLIKTLDDKAETYKLFAGFLPDYVPQYRIAHSYAEFLEMYSELTAKGKRVCYKLIKDEGACSFRIIDDSIKGDGAIMKTPGSKLTLETAKKILSLLDMICRPETADKSEETELLPEAGDGINGSVSEETSVPDMLREYKKLRDEGVITNEEFEAKKAQLLGLQ